MVDVVDQATRSRMMSGIRGKDTGPELLLRRSLHRMGLRYRLHSPNLPGSPDLVLTKWGVAIFVHGCFWHQHQGCRFATTPATRPEFWIPKLQKNVERDRRAILELKKMGWRTGIVWECHLRQNTGDQVAAEVSVWLRSAAHHAEFPRAAK